MFEFDHHAAPGTTTTTDATLGAPGKRTLTAGLPRREIRATPAPGGDAAPSPSVDAAFSLHLAARPGAEVADDAEGAVARAAAAGGGEALPASQQARFERSLGTELGDVRIHRSAASADAAAATGARAYAHGASIHFAAGAYDPDSAAGQHLVAHEVAHTVQQRGGAATPQYKLTVSQPGDALEVEADAAASAMMAGASTTVTRGAAATIARAPAGDPAAPAGPPPQAMDPTARAKVQADAQHRIDKAFTAYAAGCAANAAALEKAAKAEAEIVALVIDVGMGFLIPGLGKGLAAILGKLPAATPAFITDMTALLQNVDTAKALFTGATKTATTETKLHASKLFGDTDALLFIRALQDVTQAGFQSLSESLDGCTDAELVATWALFDASLTNTSAYTAAIASLVAHFQSQIGGQGKTSGGGAGVSWSSEVFAVMVKEPGPTGHHIPVIVHVGSGAGGGGAGAGPMSFVEWVDPALRELATAKTQEVTGAPIRYVFPNEILGLPSTGP